MFINGRTGERISSYLNFWKIFIREIKRFKIAFLIISSDKCLLNGKKLMKAFLDSNLYISKSYQRDMLQVIHGF